MKERVVPLGLAHHHVISWRSWLLTRRTPPIQSLNLTVGWGWSSRVVITNKLSTSSSLNSSRVLRLHQEILSECEDDYPAEESDAGHEAHQGEDGDVLTVVKVELCSAKQDCEHDHDHGDHDDN